MIASIPQRGACVIEQQSGAIYLILDRLELLLNALNLGAGFQKQLQV
jgi:hypothetical protein